VGLSVLANITRRLLEKPAVGMTGNGSTVQVEVGAIFCGFQNQLVGKIVIGPLWLIRF
jgi:hypothetical protein